MFRTTIGLTAVAAMLLVSWEAQAQYWGQQGHYDAVPHTTTHLDYIPHGNHIDVVPHTTTHIDHVYHPTPQIPTQHYTPGPYIQQAPRQTVYYPQTQYPNQIIGGNQYYPPINQYPTYQPTYHPPYPHIDRSTHIDYVPHTTTHLDYIPHGNHVDVVPHTTTHFDAVPHTTEHYHGGH